MGLADQLPLAAPTRAVQDSGYPLVSCLDHHVNQPLRACTFQGVDLSLGLTPKNTAIVVHHIVEIHRPRCASGNALRRGHELIHLIGGLSELIDT